MTLPLSRPRTFVPTQRNRRLLLSLPACAVPLLSACGGGADLNYETEQALYVVGEAITPNKPQPIPKTPGHSAPKFWVLPALPAGLVLNTKTGDITGTPTQLSRQAAYTVFASNNQGTVQTQLRITVTGRGAWTSVATVAGARQNACIAPLPAGKVLVAGGQTANGWTDRAQIFDLVTSSWTPATSMMLLRDDPMCIALRDGRVLVFGGGIYGSEVRLTEVYDPVAHLWSPAGSIVVPRRYAAGCLLPDGKVLVSGGYRGGEYLTSVELYDPGTGAWTELPNPMADVRLGHAAVVLPGGKNVLLIGGSATAEGQGRAEVYAWDGSPSKLISSPVTGLNTQAVLLDDGSVLIVTDATTSWRFFPRTSTWKTSTPTAARQFSQMVLLADGRVLRAGGFGLDTAEIYNPDVNTWTAAAPMAQARHSAVATLLPNGSVLMVSGRNTALVDASEIYTP